MLPVPEHFDPGRIPEVWRVPYEERASEATAWAERHGIRSAAEDELRICLQLIDCQNTFCTPGFELYVAGRSGTGAVDDSRRLCEFLYRNLDAITQITGTLDTHGPAQIFHALYLVDAEGRHPEPYTLVTAEDVEGGRWRFNRELAPTLGIDPEWGERHLLHYVRTLEERKKFALTIWPYHALLGSTGHALVSAIEEAVFFHGVVRSSRPRFETKGATPHTEHYSALGPEVATGPDGEPLGERNVALLDELHSYDAVVVAGQAKSHCVAWTIADLLEGLGPDSSLARKVYLLEDCTSPVVVPGAADYTEEADAAVERFREAGMHVVRSTDPIETWPGLSGRARAAGSA
jgi:nicotinamidase-related amidase